MTKLTATECAKIAAASEVLEDLELVTPAEATELRIIALRAECDPRSLPLVDLALGSYADAHG